MTPDRNPWLESLIRPDLRPYSERAPLALQSVGRLLARLGNPHARLRVIHIAGSKGKGSTALMVEALLQASGLRAGTFTSPHLERWSERFRIGGQELSETDLEQAINALKPHVDTLSRQHPENPPSFFDALTAMALWLFERRRVDVAIMETGIGGRYDASNIVRPEVACITNVELEHTDKLGTDLAAIARQKAGILKSGAVAVLGYFDDEVARVIRDNVEAAGCKATWLGQDFEIRREGEDDNKKFIYRSTDIEIEFRLTHPGRHMAENAALAITCVAELNGTELPRLKNAVSALAHVALPGRTEILRTEPWWIVDAAHTQRSITALAKVIDALPVTDRHFIVSLSGDKSIKLLAPLLDTAGLIIATSSEPLRSTPASILGTQLSKLYPGKDVQTEIDLKTALERAKSVLRPSSLLCATGSTYIAGAARRLLLSSAGQEASAASPNRSLVSVKNDAENGRASPSANTPLESVSEVIAVEAKRPS